MQREELPTGRPESSRTRRESGADETGRHRKATGGGDPLTLRGLSAVGPRVSRAIRGTDPARQRQLDEWEGRG